MTVNYSSGDGPYPINPPYPHSSPLIETKKVQWKNLKTMDLEINKYSFIVYIKVRVLHSQRRVMEFILMKKSINVKFKVTFILLSTIISMYILVRKFH